MIDGMPNRPLYFYQKDIADCGCVINRSSTEHRWSVRAMRLFQIGSCRKLHLPSGYVKIAIKKITIYSEFPYKKKNMVMFHSYVKLPEDKSH